MEVNDSPAHNLSGEILDGKWLVKEKIKRPDGHTGGAYSVCYKASRLKGDTGNEIYEEEYFLKTYDLMVYLRKDVGGDIFSQINKMTSQYDYEKRLSSICKENYVTKVVCVLDSGQIVKSYGELGIPVPYLLFDMADGDMHKFLDFNKDIENTWKFKSLHDIAVGLKQLHAIKIYHQDVKPSNILTYTSESSQTETKIGDLGRSIKEDLNCPFISDKWWGDKTYLPPELAYSSPEMDIKERMLLTDHYLLGSLIVFYFFGYTYNANFYAGMEAPLKPENSTMTYNEIKTCLVNRYVDMMDHLRDRLSFNDEKTDDKFFNLIAYLVNPDIEKRHSPNVSARTIHQKYSLEKVVSDLDYLHKWSKFKLRQK